MSTVTNHTAFEAGTLEAGRVACSYASTGKTRGDFQIMFRSSGANATNMSRVPDSALDSMSLALWSAAIIHLCPRAATETTGTRIPVWVGILGVLVGLPLVLWLISLLIGFIRVASAGPKGRREANEFISAWERTTFIPITQLNDAERRVIKDLMAKWRAAKASGDTRSAQEFIQATIESENHGSERDTSG